MPLPVVPTVVDVVVPLAAVVARLVMPLPVVSTVVGVAVCLAAVVIRITDVAVWMVMSLPNGSTVAYVRGEQLSFWRCSPARQDAMRSWQSYTCWYSFSTSSSRTSSFVSSLTILVVTHLLVFVFYIIFMHQQFCFFFDGVQLFLKIIQ